MVPNARSLGKIIGTRAIVVVGIVGSLVWPLDAKPAGKFMYLGPAQDFHSKYSDTITVSDTMAAMAENIYVPPLFVQGLVADTPSIFFIIDHSTSMSHDGAMNDRMGNRFAVTSAFIDTIVKKFPTADVGIGIFKQMLHFRAGDSPYFTAHPMPYDPGGAYLPLYKMNGIYGGQTGMNVLKSFLTTKIEHDLMNNVDYAELTYTPSTWPDEGTNINVGFEVAKKALLDSPRDKECHYVIFLSDGDANDELSADEFEFEKGTNVPTTFTIFFTPGTTIPGSIRRMTENIRINNYSLSNPRSNHWPFHNTSQDSLMILLMAALPPSFTGLVPALPKTLIVSGATATLWNGADSTFAFNHPFPLTERVTPFRFDFKYDAMGKDTSQTIDFFVKTQAGFAMQSKDFDVKHWDRDIVFRHNGAPITSATEMMNRLELHFPCSSGSAGYKYTNVHVYLYTVVPPIDHEVFVLSPATGAFNGSFPRVTSTTKNPGNGTLEHALSGDSIIAVFRNSETPKLPLDTLRVALPVNNAPVLPSFAAGLAVDGFTVMANVVRYTLAKPARVSFRLYDIKGRLVESAATGTKPAGSYAFRLKGRLSPGQYLVDFRAGENRMRKRVAVGE